MTEELAKQFATMTPSPTERPLNPSRTRYLRAKIDAGLAVSFQWAFAKYVDPSGRQTIYRMNAQHSSTVLFAMANEGYFPEQALWAHVDEFEVNSLEALALLFRQYDDRKSSRSLGDVAGAYQGLYPQLSDVPRNIGKIGIDAVTWFNRQIEDIMVPTGDDSYSRFADQSLWPYLHWLAEVNPTGLLKKTTLVSAMFGTYNAAQTEAEAFWEAVATGGVDGDTTAPASALYNWLVADANGDLNARIEPRGYYQAAIWCWNAFRAGRTVTNVRYEQTPKGFHKISA